MTDGQEPSQAEHLNTVWQQAVDTLSPGAKVWVYSAKPLSLHDNIMIVAVQDDLTRAQLESRVRPALEHAISMALQQETRLIVTIEPATLDRMSHQDDLSSGSPGGVEMGDDLEDDEEDDQHEFVPSWAERTTTPPRIGSVAEIEVESAVRVHGGHPHWVER